MVSDNPLPGRSLRGTLKAVGRWGAKSIGRASRSHRTPAFHAPVSSPASILTSGPEFHFDPTSPVQWVPVHTSHFTRAAPSAPIFVMPTGSTNSSTLHPPSQAVRSASRKIDLEDIEVVVSAALSRIDAWFDLKHYPYDNDKVGHLIARTEQLIAPFNVTRGGEGRLEFRCRLSNDDFYWSFLGIIQPMDELIADFVWHYPDFLCMLSKHHFNDIIDMYDTPGNSHWIRDICQSRRLYRSCRRKTRP